MVGRIQGKINALVMNGEWDKLDDITKGRYQDDLDQEQLGMRIAEQIGNSVNRDHVLFNGFIDRLKDEHPTLIGQIWNGMCEVIEAREWDGRLCDITEAGAHKHRQRFI